MLHLSVAVFINHNIKEEKKNSSVRLLLRDSFFMS